MTLGTIGHLQCDTVALPRDHTESQQLPYLQPITAHPQTPTALTDTHAPYSVLPQNSTAPHTPTTCLLQPIRLSSFPAVLSECIPFTVHNVIPIVHKRASLSVLCSTPHS